MASEAESGFYSSFERLFSRHRDHSLFLPFIFGITTVTAAATTATASDDANRRDPDHELPHDRIILINPFTQGMVVIEGGAANFDSLLRDLANKCGQPPASKASIEALPTVEIGETTHDKDGECVICLEEWELGGVAKEMPCKHIFHVNCIEKWLRIHGSCPVCRHKMPVYEELYKKGDEHEGGGRRRIGREIWVSFSFSGNRGNVDTNQTPPADSNTVSSSSPRPDREIED